MASVFGIDLLRSTTELFRSAKKRSWSLSRKGFEEDIAVLAFQGRNTDVNRLVQDQIIPRLVQAHGAASRSCGTDQLPGGKLPEKDLVADPLIAADQADDHAATGHISLRHLNTQHVEALVKHALSDDPAACVEMIVDFIDMGFAPETLFIELLAPAARRLGELWEEDVCDFVAVTMGLWRLQEVLREVALCAPPAVGWRDDMPSALFSSMPGDQHSLGTLMVSECFQRAGWDTETLIEPDQKQILGTIAERPYDLVGLTVTQQSHIEMLPKLIKALRSVSFNPRITIMIGGPAISDDLERARALGADAAACDAAKAVAIAEQLVEAGEQRKARSR